MSNIKDKYVGFELEDTDGLLQQSQHVDTDHTDTSHGDTEHSDTHSDQEHADRAHQDEDHLDGENSYHTDTPHLDGRVGHEDVHEDSAAHDDHNDHGDADPEHTDSAHGDSGVHDDHTDGSGHDDTGHLDTAVAHDDVPHRDTTRNHQDTPSSHSDSDHSDTQHGDSAHGDTSHTDNHDDAAHVDTRHTDNPHVDTAHADQSVHADVHTDNGHADDSVHNDIHYDSQHTDLHDDGISGGAHLDRHLDSSDHADAHGDEGIHSDHEDTHPSSHTDFNQHSDSSHSDTDHSDVAHLDQGHRDEGYSDATHGDSEHQDVDHEDADHEDATRQHIDQSDHVDDAHGDETAHGDQDAHEDHTDFTVDPNNPHTDSGRNHRDGPHGDFWTNHVDIFDHFDVQGRHMDVHQDRVQGGGGNHVDVLHRDHQDNVANHQDFYNDSRRSENTHHSDHTDARTEHGDSADPNYFPHYDEHGDSGHGDSNHLDIAAANQQHQDTHTDTDHVDRAHQDVPHGDQTGDVTLPQIPNFRIPLGTTINTPFPAASGGTPPYNYGLDGLPQGLSSDGAHPPTVSGTYTGPEATYSVTYSVSDSAGGSASVGFLVEVYDATHNDHVDHVDHRDALPPHSDVGHNDVTHSDISAPLSIAGGDIQYTIGVPFRAQLAAATGGAPPYRYSVSGLPGGVSSTGSPPVISGTINDGGPHGIVYSVTDANGDSASIAFALTTTSIHSDAPPPPPLSLPHPQGLFGTVGLAIRPVTLPVATGGSQHYFYSVDGLPDGLSFNDVTRVISGTPTTAGSGEYTYSVRDTAQRNVHIRVAYNIGRAGQPDPGTGIRLSNQEFQAVVGTAFRQVLGPASGGTAPFRYQVTDAPFWISFDEETRRISGTPVEAGRFGLRYSVVDAQNLLAEAIIQIVVRPVGTTTTDDTPTSFPEWNSQGVLSSLLAKWTPEGVKYGVCAQLDLAIGNPTQGVRDEVFRVTDGSMPQQPSGNALPPAGWRLTRGEAVPRLRGEIRWRMYNSYFAGQQRPEWVLATIEKDATYSELNPPRVDVHSDGPIRRAPDIDIDVNPNPDPPPPAPDPPARSRAVYLRAGNSVTRPSTPSGTRPGGGWIESDDPDSILATAEFPRVFSSYTEDDGTTWSAPQRHDTYYEGVRFYRTTTNNQRPATPDASQLGGGSGSAPIPVPPGWSSGVVYPNRASRHAWIMTATGSARNHIFSRPQQLYAWTRTSWYIFATRTPDAPTTWNPPAGWTTDRLRPTRSLAVYTASRSGINVAGQFSWTNPTLDRPTVGTPTPTASRSAFKTTGTQGAPPAFPRTQGFIDGEGGWFLNASEATPNRSFPLQWCISSDRRSDGSWTPWRLRSAPGVHPNYRQVCGVWEQDYLWAVVEAGSSAPNPPPTDQSQSRDYPKTTNRNPTQGRWYGGRQPAFSNFNLDLYIATRERIWPAAWGAWAVRLLNDRDPIDPGPPTPIET